MRDFGSKLIRSTITYDLGGAVDITYAPTGMRARLTIPANHVSAAENAVAAQPDIVRVGSTPGGAFDSGGRGPGTDLHWTRRRRCGA